MKASEYYPYESTVIKRVIKLKGGELSESDFDRIFSGHKRIELSREARRASKHKCRFKDYLRPMKLRFNPVKMDDGCPVLPMHKGMQQSFLALCFWMVTEGEIAREMRDDTVYYSLT